jgi:hypothetical protein
MNKNGPKPVERKLKLLDSGLEPKLPTRSPLILALAGEEMKGEERR